MSAVMKYIVDSIPTTYRRHPSRWLLLVASVMLLSSCSQLRSFMARDLEEEDFFIGQLYADELVKETPVLSKPAVAKPSREASRTNPLGLDYSPRDNADLYAAVNDWMGTPYKYGGTDKRGVDCSAFVGAVVRKVYGVNLHRTSNEMLADVKLIDAKSLREGDLLFFTNSKGKVAHVGIYLKDGLFAHASTSAGVCVSRTDDKYWSKHFYKGGRIKK